MPLSAQKLSQTPPPTQGPPQLCHMLGTVSRLQPTWIRGCAVPGGVPGGGTGLSPCRAAIHGADGAGSEQSVEGEGSG